MSARRHRWGAPVRYDAHQNPNGCAQTERACLNGCGVVRITVHPPEGFPWIEWRTGDPGQRQVRRSATPPCAAQPSPPSVNTDSLSSRAPAVQGVCTHESRNPHGTRR